MVAPLYHLIYFILWAFKDGFHLAVGEVSDPAGQAELVGLFKGVMPEEHALDYAGDEEMGFDFIHITGWFINNPLSPFIKGEYVDLIRGICVICGSEYLQPLGHIRRF